MIWDELKDIHKGEIGLVIGNGPSLRSVPVSFLERFPSFGTNRIYLLDGFIPTYYCAMNWLVLRQSLREIDQLYTCKFILTEYASEIAGSIPLTSLPEPQFSFEPEKGVWEGHTVTYVCLQLAWWMGFETILLVGVDHQFELPHGAPNEEITAFEEDHNHFHPDYFGPGTRWNLPDLERSTWAYRLAQTAYKASGRKILNLGPKSKLTIFAKGKIKDYARIPIHRPERAPDNDHTSNAIFDRRDLRIVRIGDAAQTSDRHGELERAETQRGRARS